MPRFLVASAVLAAVQGVGSCIPEDTSKPGWGLFPGAVGSNDTGSSPGVLVVGDSLVFGVDVQKVANTIRFFGGSSSVVAAAGGASMAHFNKESLISASGLSTIEQYVNFFGDLRVTVVALGSNDARIITGELGTMDGYTVGEFQGQAELAVSNALVRSRCVVLVNVANHWELAAPAVVDQLNGILAEVGAGDTRVRHADWNAFSAPHPEWFAAPTDIHHSAEGRDAYNGFITEAVLAAFRSGC